MSAVALKSTKVITASPQQNRLLAALPAEAKARIFSRLELVPMRPGQVIHESGRTPSHVYFPIDCITSFVQVMQDGHTAEIALVGNEGVIGVDMFMGGESMQSHALVHTEGSAYCLPSRIFQNEFNQHGNLMQLILRYTGVLLMQMGQAAACNRHHSIDQQLCRWLLLGSDRLSINTIDVTQELIANMLGVRREGVTGAAGKLQRLGVISCTRGRVTVLDRKKLENLSCECYAAIRKETDRLVSYLSAAKSVAPVRGPTVQIVRPAMMRPVSSALPRPATDPV